MKAMQKLAPADPLFPTLAAEELAASYLEAIRRRLGIPHCSPGQYQTYGSSRRQPAERWLSSNPIASWPKWKTRLDTNGLAVMSTSICCRWKETEARSSQFGRRHVAGWHLALS